MYLKEIEIHNYRSISKIKLKVNKGKMTVICGANNVGKTNLLRALDLFFSLDLKKFDVTRDIPYQIAEGSRGQGYKTKIIGKFCGAKEEKIIIEAQFLNRKNSSNILVLSGTKNKVVMKESEVKKFLREFKFIFIESSNVDLSKKISELVNDEVLLTVDHLRRKKLIL